MQILDPKKFWHQKCLQIFYESKTQNSKSGHFAHCVMYVLPIWNRKMALCCMVHTSLQLSMILVLHLSTTAHYSTKPQGPQGQEDHLKLLDFPRGILSSQVFHHFFNVWIWSLFREIIFFGKSNSSSEHHLRSRRQATWQGNLARLIGTVVILITVAIAGKWLMSSF